MKDTFYFQHDYNARKDPKIIRLMQKHGLSGLGAFWCIVETLYERGGKIPIDEYNCISFDLHASDELIESVINDFDLFKSDGKVFWSNSVLDRLNRRKEISEKRKVAILKRWKSVENEIHQYKSNTNVLENDTKNKDKGKDKESISIEIDSTSAKSAKRFCPPTLEEVKSYVIEKGYTMDAERFCNFYESKGWFVGKNKMKDWQAAVRNWEKSDKANNKQSSNKQANNNINDEWK